MTTANQEGPAAHIPTICAQHEADLAAIQERMKELEATLREAALSFENAARCLLAMETSTAPFRQALEIMAAGLRISADRVRAVLPQGGRLP